MQKGNIFSTYQEYLKSDHRIGFRKEILSIRKECQNCCIKKGLQLHHINYKNIGQETNDDIIVLCGGCHDRFHKKPRRIKKYKNREDLNFTKTNVKGKESENKIYRLCERCGGEHTLQYRLFTNGKKALYMYCDKSKPRIKFMKFEELDIDTFNSKKMNKLIRNN